MWFTHWKCHILFKQNATSGTRSFVAFIKINSVQKCRRFNWIIVHFVLLGLSSIYCNFSRWIWNEYLNLNIHCYVYFGDKGPGKNCRHNILGISKRRQMPNAKESSRNVWNAFKWSKSKVIEITWTTKRQRKIFLTIFAQVHCIFNDKEGKTICFILKDT